MIFYDSIPFTSLKNLSLNNKRVFLRADLNVPIQQKIILDDFRLQAIIPTLRYIQKHGGKVILATHLGRPKTENPTLLEEKLSTEQLICWFEQNGFEIEFEKDLKRAQEKSKFHFSRILLLENIRAFKQEREPSDLFATELAQLADIYINDAFATIHRNDTSIALLPNHFAANAKGIGFIVEDEMAILNQLSQEPKQPFLIILGGNKVQDKLKVLVHFLSQAPELTPCTIILAGPMAYTVLKAQGIEIGRSLYEPQSIAQAELLCTLAATTNTELILPIDHVIADNENEKGKVHREQAIPRKKAAFDIGPLSIQKFCEAISKAKTIFANGPLGKYENPEFAKGTAIILRAIAYADAFKVIGGGDLIATLMQQDLEHYFNFISTGGGATLEYLSHRNPENELAGLKALLTK